MMHAATVAGNSQVDMLLKAARAESFSGGLYVDFPHKGLAKKYFLCFAKGSGSDSEGQLWIRACPFALPLHCEFLACQEVVLDHQFANEVLQPVSHVALANTLRNRDGTLQHSGLSPSLILSREGVCDSLEHYHENCLLAAVYPLFIAWCSV